MVIDAYARGRQGGGASPGEVAGLRGEQVIVAEHGAPHSAAPAEPLIPFACRRTAIRPMLVHRRAGVLRSCGWRSDRTGMSLPGIANASLSMSQSQAQWDAIAAIKANSPFATQADASTSSAASR